MGGTGNSVQYVEYSEGADGDHVQDPGEGLCGSLNNRQVYQYLYVASQTNSHVWTSCVFLQGPKTSCIETPYPSVHAWFRARCARAQLQWFSNITVGP